MHSFRLFFSIVGGVPGCSGGRNRNNHFYWSCLVPLFVLSQLPWPEGANYIERGMESFVCAEKHVRLMTVRFMFPTRFFLSKYCNSEYVVPGRSSSAIETILGEPPSVWVVEDFLPLMSFLQWMCPHWWIASCCDEMEITFPGVSIPSPSSSAT